MALSGFRVCFQSRPIQQGLTEAITLQKVLSLEKQSYKFCTSEEHKKGHIEKQTFISKDRWWHGLQIA